MTDESNDKNSDKMNPQKLNSLAEDANQGQAAHHPKKPVLTKREIMEALSRERFPWEE